MIIKPDAFIYDTPRIKAKIEKPLIFPFRELIKTELVESDKNTAVLKIKHFNGLKENIASLLKVPLSKLETYKTNNTNCYALSPGTYSIQASKEKTEINIVETSDIENTNLVLTGLDGLIIPDFESKYQITGICKITSSSDDFYRIIHSNRQWKSALPAAAAVYWTLAAVPENVKIVPVIYSEPDCFILYNLNNGRALFLKLSNKRESPLMFSEGTTQTGIEPEKWYKISGEQFGVSKEIADYFQRKMMTLTEEWWGLRFPGTPYYYTHREDGPAHLRYSNNKIIEEEWYLNNRLHRKDGPARAEYSSGIKLKEEWFVDGVLHSEGHPAVTSYFSSGTKHREEWYYRGSRHRENGPAVIEYDAAGRKVAEEWYKNGMLHREDGPARIIYINTPVGKSKEFPEYYVHNRWIPENEFKKYAKIDRLLNKTAQKKKIKL